MNPIREIEHFPGLIESFHLRDDGVVDGAVLAHAEEWLPVVIHTVTGIRKDGIKTVIIFHC